MSDGLATRIGTILNGIASGLIPMAIFTPVYAIWPVFAWPAAGVAFFILALTWSIYLAVSAARLLRLGCADEGEDVGFEVHGDVVDPLVLCGGAARCGRAFGGWLRHRLGGRCGLGRSGLVDGTVGVGGAAGLGQEPTETGGPATTGTLESVREAGAVDTRFAHEATLTCCSISATRVRSSRAMFS